MGERSEWREGCEKSWSGAWERGVSGGRDVRSLGVGLGREGCEKSWSGGILDGGGGGGGSWEVGGILVRREGLGVWCPLQFSYSFLLLILPPYPHRLPPRLGLRRFFLHRFFKCHPSAGQPPSDASCLPRRE